MSSTMPSGDKQYDRSASRRLDIVSDVSPDSVLSSLKDRIIDRYKALGVDIDENATFNIGSRELFAKLRPGESGAIYLQRIELERRAPIIEHHVCGTIAHAGDAVVTDWAWSAEIAIGEKGCDPPPLPGSLIATEEGL